MFCQAGHSAYRGSQTRNGWQRGAPGTARKVTGGEDGGSRGRACRLTRRCSRRTREALLSVKVHCSALAAERQVVRHRRSHYRRWAIEPSKPKKNSGAHGNPKYCGKGTIVP